MKKEKEYQPVSGYLMLLITLLLIIVPILGIIFMKMIWLIAFIIIGVVLVWRVSDTFKAAFDVDDYVHFVDIQSEARINYIAYAREIAGAMLKRQQATAIVAARIKIVEGAVGMVEMALDALSKKQIIELDEERKANMVSNLMVVLTSDKDVAPVVNTGSIY